MSNDSNSLISDYGIDDVVEFVKKRYAAIALALVFVFMVFVRIRTYDRFIQDGKVYFSGNDAWYHFRETMYATHNWLTTMPFDPWSAYPVGADAGHFGTIYDQFIALVSLVVGLGSPSETTVRLVLAVFPVLAGASVSIVLYIIAREVYGKKVGVMSAILVALIPSVFLGRTLVGVADHNAVEPLLMGVAVLSILYTLKEVEREAFVVEHLIDRDPQLRKLAKLTGIQAAGLLVYMFTWPAGVLLIGILAVFYGAFSLVRYYNKENVESALILGVTTNALVALVFLINIQKLTFSSTHFSLMQVVLPALTAVGSAFLLISFREFKAREISLVGYAGFLSSTMIAFLGVLYFALPSVYSLFRMNFLRTVGLGASSTLRTIGEGQPLTAQGSFFSSVFSQYGLLLFIAFLAVGVLYWKDELSDSRSLFLLVWFVVLTFAGFTQVRFNYYLTLPVALFAGYTTVRIVQHTGVTVESLAERDVAGYNIIIIIMLFAAVFAPLTVMGNNVLARSSVNNPGGYMEWEEPLEWMEDNTPEYESLEYYGAYENTDDFKYQDDIYGIMSWWDYGHWITVTAERVPFANPFQQHAKAAAEYLLATDTEEADKVAESVSNPDEDNLKYVMVDWKMTSINSKFSAPVVWHPDLSTNDMYSPVYGTSQQSNNVQFLFNTKKQRYYESLVNRLYLFHGSRVQPHPVTVESTEREVRSRDGSTATVEFAPRERPPVRKFNSTAQAKRYVQENPSAQLGGVGIHPRETIEALEHFRYVKGSEASSLRNRRFAQSVLRQQRIHPDLNTRDFVLDPSAVKVFERVPGANVQGSGAPQGANVTARVVMNNPATNSSFIYQQSATADENGNFEMTLPYSTTGYDEIGSQDEYTNVSIRADGKYRFVADSVVQGGTGNGATFSTWETEKHVPEETVVGEDQEPVEVQLNRTQVQNPEISP